MLLISIVLGDIKLITNVYSLYSEGFSEIKKRNHFEILKYLFENKKASQVEISKELKLSPSTVSRCISTYVERGVLRISGKRKSDSGRRANIIEFGNEFKILGIQIDKDFVIYGVFELNHRVVKFWKDKIDSSNFISLKNSFKNQLKKIEKLKIVSTVIGFSGYILEDEVMFSSIVNWESAYSSELAGIIRDIFPNSLVFFENDANLLALREKFLERDKKNLLCIYWGYGIGMGLIINGELYVGEGKAGELGQTTFYEVPLEEYLRKMSKKELIQQWTNIIVSLIYLFHPEKVVLNSSNKGVFEEVVRTYKSNNLNIKNKLKTEIEVAVNGEKAIIEGAAILGGEIFLRKLIDT